MNKISVRHATASDCEQLSRMRAVLWPEASDSEHRTELASIVANEYNGTMPMAIFVAEVREERLIGFVEVGLRSHADGCNPTLPVGFLEGWFVINEHRRKGVGKQLLASAENWARKWGCKEMGSDTWIDEIVSQKAHEALNFEVVDRCVHYRKAL